MITISGFHAHIYFCEETLEQAQKLCEVARDKFQIAMGRVHKRPVGPHPVWSCQLAFSPEQFGEVIPWLALHRKDLVVFVHPETGDDLADHTMHALWMGKMLQLDLSKLRSTDN
jgi:DOPA 4,5-dioxygenase